MKEKDLQSKFTRWLKTNKKPGAYELKLCKTKSMPFSAVKEHQINALFKAQTEGIAYKISDFSPGYKPFDCFFLYAPAFVVIGFWQPRKLRVYMINVSEFIQMKAYSSRRSLTEEMAKGHGRIINL